MAERKGLFLDFDGVTIDSLAAMRRAYDGFLAYFGRQGSEAEFWQLNGPPLRVVIAHLKAAHDLPDPGQELIAIYEDLVVKAHAQCLPMVGVTDLIRAARDAAVRIAVVTSGPGAGVDRWLRAQGLSAWVDALISADDVLHGKPDPEPYERAMAATGVSADGSYAVEDSADGARAALDAGLSVFGLTKPGIAVSWPRDVRLAASHAEILAKLRTEAWGP